MRKIITILFGIVVVYSCTTTNDGNSATTTVVPLSPTNLVGTVNSLTTVNLSWIDNSTNETGFKIERKVSGGDYSFIGTTEAEKTTFSDSGLSFGVSYTYRVYAYNTVGKSSTYAYSLVIQTANIPVLTTTLATLTFGGFASSGGNISDNSGSDVTARGVVWSVNSNPTIDLPTKTVDGSGNGVFTSAISGLTAGTTYYVRAYATNSAGTAYGIQVTFTETAVPSNGLVGYWPFNGNANDMSGNGNNGTVNGATLTTDRFGNANSAYSFDGATNYISVPTSSNLNIIGNFTLSSWVKLAVSTISNPSYEHRFILSKNAGLTGQGTWQLALESQSNQPYQIHYNADPCYCLISKGGVNSEVSDLNWHLINVSYNSVNHELKYFLDGILVYTSTQFNYVNQITAYNLLIGKENVGIQGFFNGKLDDIGIWNRALTQAEITTLYNYR